MYGKFTVNVGVYVPEVDEYTMVKGPRSLPHEYDCCIQGRLGNLGPERTDIWWELGTTSIHELAADVFGS